MRTITLKTQLVLTFLLLTLPLAALVWSYSQLQKTLPDSFKQQAEIAANAELALSVELDIIDLQRNVLIFKENASLGATERFSILLKQIRERLDALRQSTDNQENINTIYRISGHLDDYNNNFESVISMRAQRDKLTEEIFSYTLTNEHTGIFDDHTQLKSAMDNQWLRTQNASLQYLLSANSDDISHFKQSLKDIRQLLQLSDLDSEEEETLLSSIKRHEQRFFRITNMTRNYVFLINVVMAGSANEILILSKAMAEETKQRQAIANQMLSEETSRQVQLGLSATLLVSIIIVLISAYFFRLITRQLIDMTAVFNDLAEGREVGQIPGLGRPDEIGRMAAAANVFRDKNDQTIELLQESQQHLERQHELNETILREKARAERALAARTDFLANMSHELRTPLNSVIGFTARLLKSGKNLEERQKDSLETISRNGKHLLAMINDILDLSKMEANKLEVKPEAIDLVLLCEQCFEQTKVLAQGKDLELRLSTEAYSGECFSDSTRINQIVINLLSNAIKYTHKGWVEMQLKNDKDPERIIVEITDSGIGISEDDMKNLFKRFEQFDDVSQTKIGQGTGLGLSIASKIAELIGAKLDAHSQLGVGSRFQITLPRNYFSTASSSNH